MHSILVNMGVNLIVINQPDQTKTSMEKILIFDTETTGLPIKNSFNEYHPPMHWAYYDRSRVIEVAYVVLVNGLVTKQYQSLIKPEGYNITNSDVHGITEKDANDLGVPIDDVLNQFKTDLEDVSVVVAHNLRFDANVIMAEAYRTNNEKFISAFVKCKGFCTMLQSYHMLGFNKYPKLVQLYRYFTNQSVDQKHRALDDVYLTLTCYQYLVNHQ